jgi:hypothetical protein
LEIYVESSVKKAWRRVGWQELLENVWRSMRKFNTFPQKVGKGFGSKMML